MNVCDINIRNINTSLEWSMAQELADCHLNNEALAGIFSDWINMQLLFRDLLAILPVNMLLTDDMGRVLAATPKLLREVLHCEHEDVCNKFLSAALADYLCSAKDLLALDGAISAGAQWRGELQFKSGEYIGVRMCPLPLGETTIAVLLFEPVWESAGTVWRRRLMRLIDESRDMITRGKISGGVMHDVKNMIQNLSGNVQCMQLKIAPGDSARARLDMMSGQIAEMSRLVCSYLQMGKENLASAEYSMNDLLSEAVSLIGGTIRMNRIEIFEDMADGLTDLCVDPTRIKQVLINCLENSMDAVCERQTKTTDGERFYGEIYVGTYAAEDGGVCIYVADNGVGLSEEQEKRFFEPFFTTKSNGHGIGASFSRAVVELHGGRMTAENRPEGGCRVTVYLPAKTELLKRNINFYDEMSNMNW